MNRKTIPTYPPKGRLIAAFLLAPLASALAFACFEPLYAGLPSYLDRIFRTFVMFSLVGGLPTAAVFGVPTFLVLRHRIQPTALNCTIAGGVIASFPWFILLLIPNGTDYSFDGGHVTIMNGHRTLWCWIYAAQSILQVAAFGLIGGLTFWLIATMGLRRSKVEICPR
jgi:hypothetical protein